MQDHCLLGTQCAELECFSIPLRCKFWRFSFSTDSWMGYIHNAAYVYVCGHGWKSSSHNHYGEVSSRPLHWMRKPFLTCISELCSNEQGILWTGSWRPLKNSEISYDQDLNDSWLPG